MPAASSAHFAVQFIREDPGDVFNRRVRRGRGEELDGADTKPIEVVPPRMGTDAH